MILTESDFEDSKLYDDHEMTITVTGPRAIAATWEDIQAAVTALAGPSQASWPIYRLEEPTKSFIRADEELASKLNKKTTTSTSRKFAVSFIRRQEERKNFRVLWVPPRLKLEAVKKILKQHFGDDIEISRPAEIKDGSRIDVSIPMSNVEIPHYIPVKTNDGKSIQESLWFVSVFNRRQQCHYCEDETHWPSRCPNREKRENKIEKVLGRRKNQETTVRRETDELIKNLDKKLQEERTMTYAQTVEKKKEKTPTETFKKPGHTIKPVEKKTNAPKTTPKINEKTDKNGKEEERKIRQRSYSDPRKENKTSQIQFSTPPILNISKINKQRPEDIEERAAKRYKGREETAESTEIDVIT
ncbi:hypothetical protein PoB_005776800 [Plakobranchus ocellatus]|uniref:Uncharacterized protein n=1 Tax=Plakobranchus ocellatus TaxID=259542 RepID=A0AAV4CI58_9GAST|nr:hypothetical protein PoB_005776800 [Plakobranchus ocellatus]